jgi:hypothetical protein
MSKEESKMSKENQTTEQIKNTLGASYTISEVKASLEDARITSAKQAPYFDGRLLDRIARLELALDGGDENN